MSRAKWAYQDSLWIPRAIKFAKSLEGRELTAVEQRVLDEATDPWDYFMVFGIQPETQQYLNKTIQLLEKADPNDIADTLTLKIRLDWSVRDILGILHKKFKKHGKEDFK